MTLFLGLIELLAAVLGFGAMMAPETVKFPPWHRILLSVCFVCVALSSAGRMAEALGWDYNEWIDPGSIITMTLSVMTFVFVGRGLYQRRKAESSN